MGHKFHAVTAVLAGALVFSATAKADRYSDDSGVYRYVTAHASTGGKSVTGAVREGPYGDQVQTPGGNWYNCEINCEYTLRRLTVDFWEGQADDQTYYPGYLRYEFDLDSRSLRKKRAY